MHKVHNYVLVYSAFEIYSVKVGMKYKSFCGISHYKYISIFNITDWKWENHLEFTDEIFYLFTHDSQRDANGGWNVSALLPSCITKKGWMYLNILENNEQQEIIDESKKNEELSIVGELIKCSEDLDNQKQLYMYYKKEGKTRMSILINSSI